ncbi:hypothetical protein KPH14_010331 [Odynerus spinipes]|uniref:Uncharacterized protein n=1 Tax=Odynerus spinipes TaxID=1348599 RepID=A0AAD9RU37_9HYME|nr:hypothetical protein KPH14_010331 [Odynerus spinipes]
MRRKTWGRIGKMKYKNQCCVGEPRVYGGGVASTSVCRARRKIPKKYREVTAMTPKPGLLGSVRMYIGISTERSRVEIPEVTYPPTTVVKYAKHVIAWSERIRIRKKYRFAEERDEIPKEHTNIAISRLAIESDELELRRKLEDAAEFSFFHPYLPTYLLTRGSYACAGTRDWIRPRVRLNIPGTSAISNMILQMRRT